MKSDNLGSEKDAVFLLIKIATNLLKASVSQKSMTTVLRHLANDALNHYPNSTLFEPSRIRAHAVEQWLSQTTLSERVCEAVQNMWKGGVIRWVPDLFPLASFKKFVCIKPHHDDDSLYRLTFFVDGQHRQLIVRVVPMSNVIKMVVMHNTSALDASIPHGMCIEDWATECLNSDGIANWPPYGLDDFKVCGFSGVYRPTKATNWTDQVTFGSSAERYILYETNCDAASKP